MELCQVLSGFYNVLDLFQVLSACGSVGSDILKGRVLLAAGGSSSAATGARGVRLAIPSSELDAPLDDNYHGFVGISNALESHS